MKSYLEPEDVLRLEQSAASLRDKLLIRTLFHLGCRISEVLALTPDDIDFTEGIVMIAHLKKKVNLSCAACGSHLSRSHTYCPKCGSRIGETQASQREQRR